MPGPANNNQNRGTQDNNGGNDVVLQTQAKMVTIVALVNHSCNIGGELYLLEKDQSQDVPEDAATVLQKSGKAIKR